MQQLAIYSNVINLKIYGKNLQMLINIPTHIFINSDKDKEHTVHRLVPLDRHHYDVGKNTCFSLFDRHHTLLSSHRNERVVC